MIKKVMIALTFLAITFSSIALANRALIREQAKQYDFEMCVATHANFCINQTCMTSEERDCQPQCREMAKSKCIDAEHDH